MDFLASEFDDRAQNALHHLREQSQYVRVLGSFPKNGELIGPIKSALATLANLPITTEYPSVHEVMKLKDKLPKKEQLKIGIIGFGNFGQYIAKTFAKSHTVYAVSQGDKSKVAKEIGCEDFFPLYDLVSFMELDLDVIVFSVSIISFENVLQSIPRDLLSNKLIVDVLSVKVLTATIIRYLFSILLIIETVTVGCYDCAGASEDDHVAKSPPGQRHTLHAPDVRA